MAKSTHRGHCQLCGAVQKLPGGRLALHGYTTRWGFFSGTCAGAGALPFEQSIDLIEAAIARAEQEAARLELEAAAVEADLNTVWQELYIAPRCRGDLRAGYRWEQIAVNQCNDDLEYTDKDGKKRRISTSLYGAPKTAKIAHANRIRAGYLRRRADEMHKYVAWQRARVAGWQPAELIAIEATVPA